MNLLHVSVPFSLALLGWALFVPAVLLSVRAVQRHGFLPEGAQQNAWLAGLVCVAFLWTLQVKTGDGIAFGMLGTALYVLLFGRERAVLGLTAALALLGIIHSRLINSYLFIYLLQIIVCSRHI